MAAFSEEMRALNRNAEEHAERARDELNRKWGELANKMGTLVEDIVAPNVRGVAQRYFGVREPGSFATRFCRTRPGQPGTEREFGVIAYTDALFFVAEAKCMPRQGYTEEFVAVLPQPPEYFPEAAGKELVPIFSALSVPDDVVAYLTRNGVHCMVMAGDTKVLTNFDGVRSLRPPRSGSTADAR